MNLLKSILSGLLAFLIIYFVLYSAISFVEFDGNFKQWSRVGRFVLMFGFIIAVIAGLATGFTFYRPEDQLPISGKPTT